MITDIKALLKAAYFLTEKAHDLAVRNFNDDPQYVESLRKAKLAAWGVLVDGENKN